MFRRKAPDFMPAVERQTLHEPDMGYRETVFGVGIAAMRAGTHEATWTMAGIFFTARREGEYVDPNSVFISLVRHTDMVDPATGGAHYVGEQADMLEEYVGEAASRMTSYISDSLEASRPMPTFAPGFERFA